MPCVNEIVIILVIVCTILGVICLSTDVGIASSSYDFVAIDDISLGTSSVVTGLN